METLSGATALSKMCKYLSPLPKDIKVKVHKKPNKKSRLAFLQNLAEKFTKCSQPPKPLAH